MTYSGNKPSHSEITIKDEQDTFKLISANFGTKYIVLDKDQTYLIESPVTGFLNILISENNSNCIHPYFINQNSFILKAGENVIQSIEQGDKLEWRNINNGVAIVIYLAENNIEYLSSKFEQNNDRFKNGLITKNDHRITLIYNQIIELNKKIDLLFNLRILALIVDVIIHQIEIVFAKDEHTQSMINKDQYEKIILAKQLIERDLTKNFTIPELAKIVGTNEQYLKKYFKQHFGKTVMNYITDYKMNYAKELIITGEYRVSDVARLTGYKHSTHFTTAFKKYFGFIPNSLRYTFLVAGFAAIV